MKRQTIASETRIEVLLSHAERDLILEHTFAGPNLTARMQMASVKGTRLAIDYTLDDLDELLGYIAAEANHAENPNLVKQLDKLWDRLNKKMEAYDDGG